jgi:phosphatidylglycerol:prolipoprotein diacylglycerol transferase
MLPFLINRGDLVIPTFFFMVMFSVLVTTFYLYFMAPRRGLSQIAVLDIGIFGTIGGVIGARLFHVFVEAFWFYRENPWRVFEFWRGGFVGYGAFFGILISTVIYLKIRKLPVLHYADFVATACPLIIFFVRVGCISAGCCYGKPTDFPIYLVFNNPASDAGSKFPGVHLHATQIYDMINATIIFAVVNWRYTRRKFDGEIVIIFFAMYAIGRGLIEFLRGDLDRGVYMGGAISTSQITGLINLTVCIILYIYLNHRAKRKAAALNS